MQERQHVKTVPGEQAVPEIVAHPVRKEDGHDVQTDDINIPLLGIFVVFFAVLLAVVIVSLQAWFYNVQANDRAAKMRPQESTDTELGSMLAQQRAELHTPGLARDTSPPATGPANTSAPNSNAQRHRRMTIDEAMKLTVANYQGQNNR
jgi:hypothetical protein